MANENRAEERAAKAEERAEDSFISSLNNLPRDKYEALEAKVNSGETSAATLPRHSLTTERALAMTEEYVNSHQWIANQKEEYLAAMDKLDLREIKELRTQLASGAPLEGLPRNRDLTDDEKNTFAASYLNSSRWEDTKTAQASAALNAGSVAELKDVLKWCSVTGGEAIDPITCDVAHGIADDLKQRSDGLAR